MKYLFPHIEYLLLRHDCVIVPGIGAFIASPVPAAIDYENGTVTPPGRRVMFNRAVTLDDGLLANSIARKSGISFEEARQVVVRYVANTTADLESGKTVDFGKLGTLSMGEEKNIMFSPATPGGYFNLSDCLPAASIISRPHNIETGASISCESDVNAEDDTEYRDYYHFRISKTFARIAAVMAVLIAVAVTVVFNPLPKDNREQRASVMPVENLIKSQPAEEINNAEPVTGKTLESVLPDSNISPQPTHFLIVATFSNPSEADRYIAANSSEEYPLTAVASRRLTRVAVDASDNRDELRKRLNSHEISSRFPNSWIWSRK